MANENIGWCAKCREKRLMSNTTEEIIQTKKGSRRVIKGKCSICGTSMARLDAVPKEIITNNKIDKLQEEINLEKQKEIDGQKINEFLEKSKENPIIQRNKDIIEVVDKTEKKVISKSYYTLFKIFLVLFGIIVLIFLYKTIYPEYFVPNYNSANNNVCNETLICNNTNINNQSCNCGGNYCNITFPDKIEVNIKNGSG